MKKESKNLQISQEFYLLKIKITKHGLWTHLNTIENIIYEHTIENMVYEHTIDNMVYEHTIENMVYEHTIEK